MKEYIANKLAGIRPGTFIGRIANVCEKFLARKYPRPERVLLIGRIQADRGDTESAVQTLSSGIRSNPESGELKFRKAFLLERHGRLVEAREIYESLVGLPGTDPTLLYRLSVTSDRLGDEQAALSWVANYVESNPADARANQLAYRLAAREPIWRRFAILINAEGELLEDMKWQSDVISLAYKMKRFDVCVDRYESIAHTPDRKVVSWAVASLLRLGRSEEAREVAQKFLSRQNGSKIKVAPGELLSEIGEWKLAAELHALEYSKNPDSEIAYKAGFASSRLFEWESAADWYRTAIPDSRNRKRVRYDLGLALERQRRWNEAAREYLSASTTKSVSDYRRYRAIYCLYSNGDTQAAYSVLESMDWSDYDGDSDTSLSLFASGELEEQLRLQLKRAKARQYTAGLRYVATEALALEMWHIAIEASVALVSREPNHEARNYLLLSRAYSKQGDKEKAIIAFLESRIHRDASIVSSYDYEKTLGTRRALRYGSFYRTRTFVPKTVLFESNHGSKLTCNILPLVLAFMNDSRFEGWEIYVSLEERALLPAELLDCQRIITVPRESDLYLQVLATAAWVVNNNTFPPYYCRPRTQRYLNTWHGTPIKSMGHDIKNGNFDHKNATRNFLHVTDFALPNIHTRDQLLNKYDVSSIFDGSIDLTGSPRLDLTASVSDDDIQAIRRRLGISEGATVVLYAPTWRGELGKVDTQSSQVQLVVETIQDAGCHALYRGHPVSTMHETDGTRDLPLVPDDIDTNVLLACVDVVITDYSSIAFDAALAGCKVALYAYDEDDYTTARGLSIRLCESGFPVVKSTPELQEWVACLDQIDSPALPDTFSAHEDGLATARVLEILARTTEGTRHVAPNSNVLIFEGHFIPNGITSAARELNRAVSNSENSLVIVVEPSAITPHDDRVAAFESARLGCDVLPRIGGSVDSAEQRWLISRQHQGLDLSPAQLDDIHEAYRLEFNRLFGHHQFEAVVGFEGFSLYWANLMAASKASRRIAYLHADMVEEATSRFPYLWSVFDTYKRYDLLACVSPDAKIENMRKLGSWTTEEQFAVAENIIDIDGIRERATAVVSSDYERFVQTFDEIFVAVGRVSIEKGSDRLIDSFIVAAHENSTIGLVVIGDGPLSLKLKSKIRIAGLEHRVYFTGYLESPYSHMARCDTLVLSSLHEGQGIVVLEALVLSLKVVSVDIPGPRSLLSHGFGLLVPNSTEGLVQGFKSIADGYVPEQMFDAEGYLASARQHARAMIAGGGLGRLTETEDVEG
ncbi:CDP-glycerol glycerophosphotransferase family protein [Brevibacterium sediminis]|nr:CDP-glycerol glycerophosphotransferase family protein [Brevibacterium sediminis]